jgi:hypothetical protein
MMVEQLGANLVNCVNEVSFSRAVPLGLYRCGRKRLKTECLL